MDRVEQAQAALDKANRHRLAVAAKRRELGELSFEDGRQALADLLLTCEDPAILSGRISWYLEAPVRTGPKASARVMRAMNIRRHDARVRDLTMRQREIMANAVLNQYRVELFARAA